MTELPERSSCKWGPNAKPTISMSNWANTSTPAYTQKYNHEKRTRPSPTNLVAPPANLIPPKSNAKPSLNEARLNNIEEAIKTVKSCCQAMEENAKKQTVLIEALTDLIQTEHPIFTNTLNHQQVLINNLQADLANAKKDHDGKTNVMTDLGIDNYALLDKRLDQLGVVIICKSDEVMNHAEGKLIEIVPYKEEIGKTVDEMANRLYKNSIGLPYEKKTKAPSEIKDDNDLLDGELFPPGPSRTRRRRNDQGDQGGGLRDSEHEGGGISGGSKT